ncbi:asparagine synthase-related protein [Actinomadura napierensis]|uniref:asparagine synthase-related protein n=1 Tax=Actinomadura napierensis TaxID=267854 RepID=UPI0031D9AC4D
MPQDVIAAVEWTAPDGQVAMFGWSNEPEHELLPETVVQGAGHRLGYCGYLAEPKRDSDLLLTEPDLGAAVSGLGGVFSVFRAGEDGIEAATSMARVCPVYHAESRGVRVVGSRALLVHLAARAVETGVEDPEVDILVETLQPLIRHGFFANDDTPFRGVRALPAGAVLRAPLGARTTVRQQPMPEAQKTPGRAKDQRRLIGPLAEALVDAAAPLGRHPEPVALALSGGRDSRLMAAVLKAAGVPFTGATHGFADDPDVVLVRRVSEVLGIEHHVDLTVPEGHKESVTVQHPFARTHDIVRMCEGMNSAYESVNRYRPFDPVPRTSGSGGETLRGGFLYDQDDVSAGGLRKRVRLIFFAAERLMTGEANARAAEEHRQWAEGDGFDVLDKLYLYYRTGRWIVGSHTATLMNAPYYHPFFDNRVVREALGLAPEWRRSEYPFYLLIRELAPGLADVLRRRLPRPPAGPDHGRSRRAVRHPRPGRGRGRAERRAEAVGEAALAHPHRERPAVGGVAAAPAGASAGGDPDPRLKGVTPGHAVAARSGGRR